jgi:hypothetical protein
VAIYKLILIMLLLLILNNKKCLKIVIIQTHVR